MSAGEERQDAPVFFDLSGRRWKRVRLVLAAVVLAAAGSAYVALPQAWRHDTVAAFHEALPDSTVRLDDPSAGLEPAAVVAMTGHRNTPVIGKGPLVRMLHVRQTPDGSHATMMYSPAGKSTARPLDDQERAIVGDHDFVLERYGAVSAPKQIALTFDDGPDATYTPQILDVLGRHGAQATFFVTGANVVKHSDIARREAHEGHLVANHTFNHIDFDMVSRLRGEQEINQTTRAITAATGTKSAFFRLPYMGVDEQSMRNHLTGILTAQRMGYTVASNEYDSSDWGFETGIQPAFPKLDGSSLVVLLHDAGGNRSKTVAYLEHLIADAKSKGYKFVTLDQMYRQEQPLYAPAAATLGDKTTFAVASSILVWPHRIIGQLFVWTVATLLLTLVVNVALALINKRRTHYGPRKRGYNPLVSVLVPAYNEGKVLEKSVRPVLRSYYRNLEVIIVDDGSKDDTFAIAQSLARRFKRVRAYRSPRNQGKAAALNRAITHANGEVLVAIDADTVFPPATVGRLVRHFSDPSVGAVAGNVRVGNVHNMVTRWQALDYTIGIHVERSAQACLSAVMIVPGACGAFRKAAIQDAGGYSHHTLAEDFDLTLSVQRAGYKVLQDTSAESYTEAPETVRTLAKQRFRWMYGNVQAYWKHRDMLFRRRYGWVGLFVLPWMVFAFVLPLIFVPMLMFVALENILAGNARSMLVFFAATIAIQLVIAIIGVILARERWSLLLAVPMTRLMYSPMRTFLMYRTLLNVLRGVAVGWNKLQRTGAVGQALGYARGTRPSSAMRPALAKQDDA